MGEVDEKGMDTTAGHVSQHDSPAFSKRQVNPNLFPIRQESQPTVDSREESSVQKVRKKVEISGSQRRVEVTQRDNTRNLTVRIDVQRVCRSDAAGIASVDGKRKCCSRRRRKRVLAATAGRGGRKRGRRGAENGGIDL